MDNADWRAQLREAGIDRRPPPSSKGALQDKVAAVPVTVLRPSRPNKPNNVITIEQLAKYSEPPSPTIVPRMTPAIAPEKSARRARVHSSGAERQQVKQLKRAGFESRCIHERRRKMMNI